MSAEDDTIDDLFDQSDWPPERRPLLVRVLAAISEAVTPVASMHDSLIVEVIDAQLLLRLIEHANVDLECDITATTFAGGRCEIRVEART